MGNILVVDDEGSVLDSFRRMLVRAGHEVATERRAEEALRRLDDERPDLLILDINLPGIDGIEALRQVRESAPKLPVIMMTAFGTTQTAIEATKHGAFDYQLKPFMPRDMLRMVDRALESVRLMKGNVEIAPVTVSRDTDALIGQSGAMQEVYKTIGRVAPTDATVLLRGETGVGKELVARAIYQNSPRGAAPLMVVNCAALPETLLESELFGHEKGAFTGATARRIGKFEQADGGTIFLDEIGDIPLSIQAKILRALQQKTFQRVGGNETHRSDARVIAATNRELEQGIRRGEFRQDLYHRLDVVTIHIPPLRERLEDVPALADYFLSRFAAELGREVPHLVPQAVEFLQSQTWPGNVRELEHCIHRAMIFTQGMPIQVTDIQEALKAHPAALGAQGQDDSDSDELLLNVIQGYLRSHTGNSAHTEFMQKVDKLLITETLAITEGNQTQAAKLLGLTRSTLQAKMKKHGLQRQVYLEEE